MAAAVSPTADGVPSMHILMNRERRGNANVLPTAPPFPFRLAPMGESGDYVVLPPEYVDSAQRLDFAAYGVGLYFVADPPPPVPNPHETKPSADLDPPSDEPAPDDPAPSKTRKSKGSRTSQE